MPKRLFATVVLAVALSATGCAQGSVAIAPGAATSSDEAKVCTSTTYFEHAPDSGAPSRVDAVNGMIQAIREHPDGPELEYASRTDVLLLLESSVDNLTAAAKAAGEAAQDNGYLAVTVKTPEGEYLGEVNISEINGSFYIDSFAVAHQDGKTCPS